MSTKENQMRRFGLGRSTCGEEVLTEAHFKEYAKAGVEALEISFPLRLCDGLNFPEIKRYADAYGISLWSYHLPFHGPMDMAAKEAEIRTQAIAYLMELVGKASDIGIPLFILHPSKEPCPEDEIGREEALKRAMDSLAQMAERAAKYGATIAVEDLPRTCLGRNSSEMKQLLSADERLRICFDTNHLLKQPIKEFIRDVGQSIVTTHISDYDFVDERHWMPGEGQIDWIELISELEAAGYCGPLMYEVSSAPSKHIDRRMLISEDFRVNHDKLIHKLVPEPIGRPLL